MTISIRTLSDDGDGVDHGGTLAKLLWFNNQDSWDRMKELVRRALNTWPDAHPELKGLGDLMEHGKILQDYYAQRTDKGTDIGEDGSEPIVIVHMLSKIQPTDPLPEPTPE